MGALFPISSARRLINQPVLAFSWEMVMTSLPAVIRSYAEILSTRVRVAAAPGRGSQVYETHYGPYTFTHSGLRSYPRRITMQFEESYAQQVEPIFDLWLRTIFDEESGAGEREIDTTASVWLRYVGPGAEFAKAFHLYHASPVTEADSPLGYNQDGMVMRSMTMAYDFWRFEPWPI